jgi:hypothetical protein
LRIEHAFCQFHNGFATPCSSTIQQGICFAAVKSQNTQTYQRSTCHDPINLEHKHPGQ